MIFSYTQLSRYLSCPRQYRYRYLDGWREKDSRASLLFGRCFEKALAAFFLHEDCSAVFFKEWESFRDGGLTYTSGDTWDRMARQGIHMLEMFARDDRIRIRQPRRHLQVKQMRQLSGGHEFVAHLDAVGSLDGVHCLIEWKTTVSRYPEAPTGLLALDPQLVCYSWASGISEVCVVAFVRKRVPEIQYLRATITEGQRLEFSRLVETTLGQVAAGQFLPHSGIRFPQNGCLSCSCLGLCLNQPQMVDAKLVRLPGASDLDWLDQLEG